MIPLCSTAMRLQLLLFLLIYQLRILTVIYTLSFQIGIQSISKIPLLIKFYLTYKMTVKISQPIPVHASHITSLFPINSGNTWDCTVVMNSNFSPLTTALSNLSSKDGFKSANLFFVSVCATSMPILNHYFRLLNVRTQ